MRAIILVTAFLISASLVLAEPVQLSGTVKKTGGSAGLADVKISLAKLKSLSTTTNANGVFDLSGTTSIRVDQQQIPSYHFVLRGNAILFSPLFRGNTGSLNLYSCNGKMVASFGLHDRPVDKQCLTLPYLGSGIYLLRITLGSASFTRTLVSQDNHLFMINENATTVSGVNFAPDKQAAAVPVDTLVASKSGYITKKFPIDNYTKSSILIELDSTDAGGKCTREALQAAIDSYIEAQKAGDPTKMALAANVKYKQNMKDIAADKSICKTALPTIASQRNIIDVDSCRTFTELIITAGSHPYVIGTRLKLENGKIAEINTMVTDNNDWLFDATKYLSNSKDEKWAILPAEQRCDRQTLINAGNAYFDLIFDWTKDTVPWSDPCYRIEGGSAVANPCSQGTTGNSVKTTCRTYVVDVEIGAVNMYCYFGYGPDSHLFRMQNKKIIYIHTMTACGDTVASGKDCWGTAAKGKGKAYCDW